MNVVVFDTETVSVNKPFCYNVGFVIFNTELEKIVDKKEYVVEQIWHNKALFETSYYYEKKPIYVNRMRAKKIKMDKWGRICQEMIKLFKFYNVQFAYAYNSPFDDRVFNFNTEWYKNINPFDNIPIIDIAPLVHKTMAFTSDYQNFCDTHSLFTDSGNYSTTAETVYRYIAKQVDFDEEHTALADSEIELEILRYCINKGCEWGIEYKKYSSIPRKKEVIIIDKTTEEVAEMTFNCKQVRISKDRTKITLR